MNEFIKWIMIVLICTIFAMDGIVLLSLKAGAAIFVSQEPVANSPANVTGGSMGFGVQFIDNQSTNCSSSLFSNSGNGGNTTIRNPSNIMQI
jgi:PKD repeat protein